MNTTENKSTNPGIEADRKCSVCGALKSLGCGCEAAAPANRATIGLVDEAKTIKLADLKPEMNEDGLEPVEGLTLVINQLGEQICEQLKRRNDLEELRFIIMKNVELLVIVRDEYFRYLKMRSKNDSEALS